MKKGLLFILLILFSCQKDELLEEPTPSTTFIFDQSTNIVSDGQDISFELSDVDFYTLLLIANNTLLTKESFQSQVGVNTRKIYTKVLPSGKYQLVLQKGSEQINTTFILVE